MLRDEFKERYTTIPFAIYKTDDFCGTDDVITHYHREIELIAIIDGAANFYVDSVRYRAERGDVLIIPPYSLHHACGVAEKKTSYYCICFDSELLCDEALNHGLEARSLTVEHLIKSSEPFASQLHSYVKTAVTCYEEGKSGWELESMGNISLFFATLKREGLVREGSDNNKKTDFAKRVMTYLTEHVAEIITSRDVAKSLYITHSYFCRLFKRTFGCVFANYLLVFRLEKSRIRLLNTADSVTDIAYDLGFNNCSYFGKKFKERFGMSPLSYRKNKNGR